MNRTLENNVGTNSALNAFGTLTTPEPTVQNSDLRPLYERGVADLATLTYKSGQITAAMEGLNLDYSSVRVIASDGKLISSGRTSLNQANAAWVQFSTNDGNVVSISKADWQRLMTDIGRLSENPAICDGVRAHVWSSKSNTTETQTLRGGSWQ